MISDGGTVQLRMGDRVFERVYIEVSTWRWRDEPKGPVTHVNLTTEAWFENGVLLVSVKCTKGGEKPYFEGDDDPTGLSMQKHLPRSAAIRLSIAAHDHALQAVLPTLHKDAERLS